MKKIIVVLVVLIGVIYLFGFYSDFLQIDRCLDKGGRWNDDFKQCEFAR